MLHNIKAVNSKFWLNGYGEGNKIKESLEWCPQLYRRAETLCYGILQTTFFARSKGVRQTLTRDRKTMLSRENV